MGVRKAGTKGNDERRISSKSAAPSFVVITACLGYLIALIIPFGSDMYRLAAVGIVLCCTSLFTFFSAGKKVIVASSAFSYGVLMFIGFPAVYSGLGFYVSRKDSTFGSLLAVVTLSFLLQVFIYLASHKRLNLESEKQDNYEKGVPSFSTTRSGLILALIMLVLFILSRYLGIPFVVGGLGWLSLVFAAIAAFDLKTGKIHPLSLGLVGLAFLVVMGDEVGGFGRLNLAVVALSLSIVASIALRTWLVKVATILITVPALIFLVYQRVEFLQQERGGLIDLDQGIGSVVGPIHSAATIIEAYQHGTIGLAFGATIVVAALAWVPRAIWSGKPDGFGREIVEVTQPWLVSTKGHSDAGTIVGEAVWNFGIFGAFLFFWVVVFVSRRLDARLLMHADGVNSLRGMISFIISILLSASLLNMVWGGTFTTVSRVMVPIAILLVLVLMLPANHGPILKHGSYRRTGIAS